MSDLSKFWLKQVKKLEKENKNMKLILEQMENTCKDYLNDRDTLREENRKLKEELSAVYKAYHTAMWVDYNNEEDLYTIEDIEWHNAE